MTNGEAFKLAAGYAWGYSDATGVPTCTRTEMFGAVAFGEAYSSMNDDFNRGGRVDMPAVQSSYALWQFSHGTHVSDGLVMS